MINWIPLVSAEQLPAIVERSGQIPCIIFKHSISCSISSLAKYRLENQWDIPNEQLEVYFLDLIRYREVSRLVAEHFGIRHESPQVLLIRDGRCVYDSSHLDISIGNIKEVISEAVDM